MTVMTADGGSTGDADLDALTTEDPLNKEGGEGDDGLDVAALAKELGHVEKEKYRGKEEDWLPPERFVQKRLKDAAAERARIRFQDDYIKKQDKELAELKDRLGETSGAVKELLTEYKGAKERGYARMREDILKRQRDAVREADEAAYDAAARELDELDKQRTQTQSATATKKPAASEEDDDSKKGPNPGSHPHVREFLQNNAWARPGSAKHNWAVREEMNVGEELGLAGYENTEARLAEVRKRAMEKWPDMFENGARRGAAAVARPAGGGNGQRRKAKTVADLPEDAKRALALVKKRDPKFTDEMYLKSYQWE